MSDTIYNAFADGMATLNTELTAAFAKDGTRCFLLRPGGETSSLSVVDELTSGFRARWSEFRQQTQFRYASVTDVTDKFARTTHIAYGVPDGSGKLEVYVIEDPSRDIVSPDASSPFWKAYANKDRTMRFTIPTPEP